MHHFVRRGGALYCEDAPLSALAEEFGTPLYVYSSATLERHFRLLKEAFALESPLIAFAVKANPSLAVLHWLRRLGAGADTVSGGEISRALAAGIAPEKIVFSGVGKTDAELRFAIQAGVKQINVESPPELDRLASLAGQLGRNAPVAIRINPSVASGGGHEKISTGGGDSKFGVSLADAAPLYAKACADPALIPMGLACHIGSQMRDLAPFQAALSAMSALARDLRSAGCPMRTIDIGGGVGAMYRDGETPPGIDAYRDAARAGLQGLDLELILEPGRLIAANAGVLLARVILVHERAGRTFAVLDAGMNDLMRPALYDAYHEIEPVFPRPGDKRAYDVVGPVCESSDVFARGRLISPLEAGDLCAFMGVGAYGASMASLYNLRALPAEAFVVGERWALTRKRIDPSEFSAFDALPDWLS